MQLQTEEDSPKLPAVLQTEQALSDVQFKQPGMKVAHFEQTAFFKA